MLRFIPLFLFTLAACDEATQEAYQADDAPTVHRSQSQGPIVVTNADYSVTPVGVYEGPGDVVPAPPPGTSNCFVGLGVASCRAINFQILCAWNADWVTYDAGLSPTIIAGDTAESMSSYALATFGTNAYPSATCTQHYAVGASMYFGLAGPLSCGRSNPALSGACVSESLDDLAMDVETLYTFQQL